LETDLKEKLNTDFRQAMKDGDKVRRSTLRLVLAAVKNAEIAKQTVLTNGDILGIISKEVKQHQEMVDQEEAELAILEEYMPQQMTRDEIIAEARIAIEEAGAQGPGDKGKVMPKIIARLKGRADGREINEIVTELLSS